jgi:hypothetical protein
VAPPTIRNSGGEPNFLNGLTSARIEEDYAGLF